PTVTPLAASSAQNAGVQARGHELERKHREVFEQALDEGLTRGADLACRRPMDAVPELRGRDGRRRDLLVALLGEHALEVESRALGGDQNARVDAYEIVPHA